MPQSEESNFVPTVWRGEDGPCFDVRTPHNVRVQLQGAADPECTGFLVLVGRGAQGGGVFV